MYSEEKCFLIQIEEKCFRLFQILFETWECDKISNIYISDHHFSKCLTKTDSKSRTIQDT